MVRTLVVGLDLEEDGDRSLPVVRALAARGSVDVELVTVTAATVSSAADAFELERRAIDLGIGPDAWTVIRADDPAAALLQHTASRPGGLLVLATAARRPFTSSLVGSVVHDVLCRTDRPVLLVGPNVPADVALVPTTLVPCLGAGDPAAAEPAIDPIVDWQRTFGGDGPKLVEVLEDATDAAGALWRLDEVASRLATEGVDAACRVVTPTDDEGVLSGFRRAIDGVTGPVFLVVSARATGGAWHWSSTTQQLVRQAPCPVLVVPAHATPLPVVEARDEHVAFHDVAVGSVAR